MSDESADPQEEQQEQLDPDSREAELAASFSSTATYELPKSDPDDPSLGGPVHVDMPDASGERFEADFQPGKHKPKSEREEAALEHLASLGLATKVKG